MAHEEQALCIGGVSGAAHGAWHHWCTPHAPAGNQGTERRGGRLVNILHPLAFARGSEALEFVRTLRELVESQLQAEVDGIGPVLVYGARIVAPDVPAELYVSLGALTLAHLLGVQSAHGSAIGKVPIASELPADMALLFTARVMPDERGSRLRT
jgi:hypothetical protein